MSRSEEVGVLCDPRMEKTALEVVKTARMLKAATAELGFDGRGQSAAAQASFRRLASTFRRQSRGLQMILNRPESTDAERQIATYHIQLLLLTESELRPATVDAMN